MKNGASLSFPSRPGAGTPSRCAATTAASSRPRSASTTSGTCSTGRRSRSTWLRRRATKAWTLKDASGATVASGTSSDYVAGDFASGDSFFRDRLLVVRRHGPRPPAQRRRAGLGAVRRRRREPVRPARRGELRLLQGPPRPRDGVRQVPPQLDDRPHRRPVLVRRRRQGQLPDEHRDRRVGAHEPVREVGPRRTRRSAARRRSTRR